MKKCGCKRNLLGVCSCKRVSRGRKTRRAITDEPYERSIRPRYAVPRSRRPEYNFPAIDPKRPGQVLRPGVPSVSTGFTAPSPFSRGATSAFEPVLRAASNYLNEVTRSARLQNQITMSNMGGGGSAGSGSNIVVNGSVSGRNTATIVSKNRNVAPQFENTNVINNDGTYASSSMGDDDLFEVNSETARRNFNRVSAIGRDDTSVMDIDNNNIDYKEQVDQAREDNNAKFSDNEKFIFETMMNLPRSQRLGLLDDMRKEGKLDRFEEDFDSWVQSGTPPPDMSKVSKKLQEDYQDFLQRQQQPNAPEMDVSGDNLGIVEVSDNYKLQNYDPNSLNNAPNQIFISPPKQPNKNQSVFGNQDIRQKQNQVSGDSTVTDDLNTESQLEPSEFTEGSVALSSISSKRTRTSADDKIAQQAREKEVQKAEQKGVGLRTRGGGNLEVEKIKENKFEKDSTMQALEKAGPLAQIEFARNLGGWGHKRKSEQEEMLDKQKAKQNSKQATNNPLSNVQLKEDDKNKKQGSNSVVNVPLVKSKSKKNDNRIFAG